MPSLNNLTVLGSGVLGGQIAWHSAFHGKTVVVYDISDQAIEGCRLAQGTPPSMRTISGPMPTASPPPGNGCPTPPTCRRRSPRPTSSSRPSRSPRT
ncbi:3-hydroxyacyl-CoA dehydrogenase NAD-binding domain-containing protein [Streptomyces chartreusis]|uniref:3-hydroxyacyl-CoA dehydrogenase NAD-binding domain-containing protein n=1 Tax=Streptomyces chartreusis TaxID=1969 RepID=UPI00362AD4B5